MRCMLRRYLLVFMGLWGCVGLTRAADGLLDLLQRARASDPEYRSALAARDAGLQSRVLGRAYLLPTVSAIYEAGSSDLRREYQNAAPPLSYEAHSRTTTLRLSQPLFSLERWAAWKEEDARAVLAELRFIESSTELTLRLSRAVFDTLLAVDNLELARAQHKTLISQRTEAEKLREAGVMTRVEVEDTRARELTAKAGELEAAFGVEMRRRELARIVGELPPGRPAGIRNWSLVPAQPDDIDAWLRAVQDANPKIVTARTSLEVMSHAATRARAAHYPAVDLIASSTRTQNPNIYTGLENSSGVAVRLTVPLFEGGRTEAGAVRAAALRTQAEEELESARREAIVKASEAFLGMANARAKVQALEQALNAAQTGLEGATLGRKAGLRTHTEVLNALQQVFAVTRDLNKERYNHLLAGLQLKALTGQLADEDLAGMGPMELARPSRP